ncbi:hypothetical protein, partial [Sinorhizobium meliloti]|uniref:hypothetical protein n=1 Tax=Rhizobium meliloti TaxID=382 RepID=UPI001AEC90DF
AAAINRFQQLGENARGEPHAPSPFLSLDNQKIDGKTPSDGACACDISIHPELSPDSPAACGEKGFAAPARDLSATGSSGAECMPREGWKRETSVRSSLQLPGHIAEETTASIGHKALSASSAAHRPRAAPARRAPMHDAVAERCSNPQLS